MYCDYCIIFHEIYMYNSISQWYFFLRKRLSTSQCLSHKWLAQDVKFMRAKRLSTAKHKRFMARRKWQVWIYGYENPSHHKYCCVFTV